VSEFYAGGAAGYTDYPNLSQSRRSPDLNGNQKRANARASSEA
jgi:hypothetical protein